MRDNSHGTDNSAGKSPTKSDYSQANADRAALVEGTLRVRRSRDALLGPKLFSDPAWEILLLLYLSALRSQQVTVSDCAVDTGMSEATATRWVATLEAQDMLKRSKDANDRRRCFIAATPFTFNAMNRLFDNASWQRPATLDPIAANLNIDPVNMRLNK